MQVEQGRADFAPGFMPQTMQATDQRRVLDAISHTHALVPGDAITVTQHAVADEPARHAALRQCSVNKGGRSVL